jgi:hypothetical protein
MTVNKENDILTPEIRFHLIRRMERHKVIPLAGPRLLPHEKKYLEFHNVSGVILFARNIESLSQIGELIAAVTEELAWMDRRRSSWRITKVISLRS